MALPMVYIENGTLVADVELRFTPNGKAVCNFRVASNSRRKNQQTGQWENGDSTFLTVNAWEGLAENVASTFQKGSKVNVKGFLKQREYEKDGQKRTVFEVEALDVASPVSRFVDDGKSSGDKWNSAPSGGGFANEEAPF